MRRIVFLMALAALAGMALAQRPSFASSSRTFLAMMPDVRKEIKLTKDQDKKIQEALKEMERKLQAGTLPPGFNIMDPMAGFDIDLEPILDEAQRARLDELFVQANGGFALDDKVVSAKLGLTDEQKSAIRSRKAEATGEIAEKMMQVRSPGAMKEIEKMRGAHDAALLEMLTPEQKATLETLKGKPFKFKT
jgi:hypothetical protein